MRLHLLTSSSSEEGDDAHDGLDGSDDGTPRLMQIPVSPVPSQEMPLGLSPAPGDPSGQLPYACLLYWT